MNTSVLSLTISMNDYELLVETAAKVGPVDALDDHYWGERTEAKEFLHANSGLLTSARKIVSRDCRIPIRYDAEFFSDHSGAFQHIRNFAKALSVQLRHLDMIGNTTESVAVGLDMLRLANVSRCGLIVDLLVGIAIEGMAFEGLRKIRRRLPLEQCATTVSALRQLEDNREPYQDVANRDREWTAAVGWEDAPIDIPAWELSDPGECGMDEEGQLALRDLIEHLTNLPTSDKIAMHLSLDRRMMAMSRLLRTELSLQHTRAISGSYPSELKCSDLIDPTSCIDPFTGNVFLYRQPKTDSFTLYSPGPTQIDNGGEFGSWLMVEAGRADLCLDISDYDDCEIPHTTQRTTLFCTITKYVKKWMRLP